MGCLQISVFFFWGHLEEQVAAVDKLHDKEQAVRCLEAGMHGDQERVLAGHCEHILLGNGALHVVVLHQHVLLQHLVTMPNERS